MKYLLIFVTLLLSCSNCLFAQVGIEGFVSELAKKYQRKQLSYIKDIQQYAKEANCTHEIQSNSTEYIPVVYITTKRLYKKHFDYCPETLSSWIDSSFVYLDPKSLYLEQVFVYQNGIPYQRIWRKYDNKNERPIDQLMYGRSDYELAELVYSKKPNMVFCFFQDIFALVKNGKVITWIIPGPRSGKSFDLVKDYLLNMDCTDLYFLFSQVKPRPIYWVGIGGDKDYR